MTAQPPLGAEFFTAPAQPSQRRYEALRAYFVERVSVAEAGARVGYTRPSMASLLRDFRAGKVAMFAAPAKPAATPTPSASSSSPAWAARHLPSSSPTTTPSRRKP